MNVEDVRRELAFWNRYGQAPPEPIIRIYAETIARCTTANLSIPLGLQVFES